MGSWDIERLDHWVPAELLRALREAAGRHRLHLVGGAVRDHRLGRDAPDFDLVADGSAEDLGRWLAKRLDGRFVSLAGERFAAYRVVARDLIVDLWGRGDTPLETELARRDLTINAIAVDAENGSVCDPFGGTEDLERRILRATTERGFVEDPLRVVRLARFAAELDGFTVDPATLELARRAAPGIDGVAVERVREEVAKTLAASGRARGLEILTACGLYPRLWGGDATAVPIKAATRLAAIEPTRKRLLESLEPELYAFDPVPVSQALLFSPPGGGATAAAGPLLTRREAVRVVSLLELGELPEDEGQGRWFLRRWSRRWGEAVVFAVLRPSPGTAASAVATRLADLARRHGHELFELRRLLDGDEVAALLDLAPGPEIGRALEAMERQQVAGVVRTRAEARAFLIERFGAPGAAGKPRER